MKLATAIKREVPNITKNINLQDGAYWKLLGIELDNAEGGKALCKMSLKNDLLHIYGKAHGGAIASLIDSTIAAAGHSVVQEDEITNTVELSVNYIRPVSEGSLSCVGKIVHFGKTIVLGEATVKNAIGNEVARGKATLIRLQKNR